MSYFPYAQVGAGVDGGECAAPITLGKWPSDVDALKARIDSFAVSTDLTVQACKTLSVTDRAAWAKFFAEWSTFAAKKTPLFGSANEWVTACSYSNTIGDWREKIAKSCSLSGPTTTTADPANTLKWIIGGAAVLGVVGLAYLYAPEIKALVR